MPGVVGSLAWKGLRKGFMDGSRPWMVVGVAAGLVALARRAARPEPEVVGRAELHPGEGLVVRVEAPPEA